MVTHTLINTPVTGSSPCLSPLTSFHRASWDHLPKRLLFTPQELLVSRTALEGTQSGTRGEVRKVGKDRRMQGSVHVLETW